MPAAEVIPVQSAVPSPGPTPSILDEIAGTPASAAAGSGQVPTVRTVRTPSTDC